MLLVDIVQRQTSCCSMRRGGGWTCEARCLSVSLSPSRPAADEQASLILIIDPSCAVQEHEILQMLWILFQFDGRSTFRRRQELSASRDHYGHHHNQPNARVSRHMLHTREGKKQFEKRKNKQYNRARNPRSSRRKGRQNPPRFLPHTQLSTRFRQLMIPRTLQHA